MKKIMIIAIAVLSLATMSFAADKLEKVSGKIVSIDAAKSMVVVTDKVTGKDRTITIDAKKLDAFKAGDEVTYGIVGVGCRIIERIGFLNFPI